MSWPLPGSLRLLNLVESVSTDLIRVLNCFGCILNLSDSVDRNINLYSNNYMSYLGKSFNQNSLTQPNNNDYEDGELDRNHGSVAKSAYQKSSKQDKYNSQQFQQFESPSQQTGQKGSNLIN